MERLTKDQVTERIVKSFWRIGINVQAHTQQLDGTKVRIVTADGGWDIGPRCSLKEMDYFLDGFNCAIDEMQRPKFPIV